MPMGIVDDSEFEAELKNSGVPLIKEVKAGRPSGSTEVPDALRKIIGEQSVIEGRASALELAESFGLSKSSVSAYAVGATSTATYDKPSVELTEHIEGRKQRVVNTALSRLQRSLMLLDRHRISTASPREIAAIAKDMASIVKTMEPPPSDSPKDNSNQPQFIVYAPQVRDERHFGDVIQAKE